MIQSPLLTTFSFINHAFGTLADDKIPSDVVTVKQVHGTYLYFVEEDREIEKPGYDILMTEKKGTRIGVKTADCLPILMVEPKKRIIVAAHAGWRGTLEKIARTACEEITKRGGSVENLSVALGPCIGGRCYEVEKEVALPFQKKFPNHPSFLTRKSETKWLLDIGRANRDEFIAAGVKPEKIDQIDLCTHCRPDLFHSYRREGKTDKRMVNFIGLL
ncbi:MAG: peptidoglycan editing factor PgeF [Deltaproteobacteria bacterium]|nr:peptidoglycan editing factor PgeF [Deltaproteobacteria bacterium]